MAFKRLAGHARDILVSAGGSLVVLAGVAVVALLRAHQSVVAGPLVYGVVTFCALSAVCLLSFLVVMLRRMEAAQEREREERKELLCKEEAKRVTPENADAKLHAWLRAAEFSVVYPDVAPDRSLFEVTVLTQSGKTTIPVTLAIAKKVLGHLILESILWLSDRQKEIWRNLTPQAQGCVATQLRMDMSGLNIRHSVDLPETVRVYRMLPLADLTESGFTDSLDRFLSAVVYVRDWLFLAFVRMADGKHV